MSLSLQADNLIKEFARDQGLAKLEFNADGMIPITLGDLTLAVAYSPANDSFVLFGALGAADDGTTLDAWKAFEVTAALTGARSRVAMVPDSRQVLLVAEIIVAGLDYRSFKAALEAFVADCGTARKALFGDGAPAGSMPGLSWPELTGGGDFIVFRP